MMFENARKQASEWLETPAGEVEQVRRENVDHH